MWATGNGGLTDDDCNCDGYTTSIYTISVGCIGDHGLSAYYTELCSSTLGVTFNGGSHREKEENKMVSILIVHRKISRHNNSVERLWCSGDNARLHHVLWPGVESWTRRYKRIEFVVGSRLAVRVFLRVLRFSTMHKKHF